MVNQQQVLKAEKKLVLSSAFTLSNTMLGCAVLSLAYAFAQIGWVISLILLAICVVFEYFTFNALVDCAHYGKHRTLRGMMEEVVGKKGAYVLDFCIAFSYLGYLTVYVSIFGDYIQAFVIQVGGGEFDVRYIKLIGAPFLLAATFLKSSDAISKSSAFAILFIVVTVIAVIIYFFIYVAKGSYTMNTIDGPVVKDFPGPIPTLWPINAGPVGALDVFKNIPLFMPLFGAQASVPVLYYDLQGPPNFKRRVMRKSSLMALIMSTIMYIIVALFGVWMFGVDIRDNILMSFLPTEVAMTIVRLLYSLVVILSYMVIVYPVRATFMDWANLDLTTKKGTTVFYIIGAAIVVVSVSLSIAVPSISKVINIISAIFGTVVYWCVPILAIWIVPRLHAITTVPETDDDLDVEERTEQTRGRSFSTILMEQQAGFIRNFARHDQFVRPRTRSEVLDQIRAQRTRTGSVDLPSVLQNVVENAEQPSPAADVLAEASKPRAASISVPRPTLENDLLQEPKKPAEVTHLPQVAAVEESSGEKQVSIEVATEQSQMDQNRSALLKKMTPLRLVWCWLGNIFAVAINLLSFVLGFVDYSQIK